jgi:hypothetical protein
VDGFGNDHIALKTAKTRPRVPIGPSDRLRVGEASNRPFAFGDRPEARQLFSFNMHNKMLTLTR